MNLPVTSFSLRAPPANIQPATGSTERCILCEEGLSVVGHGACNHRLYCISCYKGLLTQRGRRDYVPCPLCRDTRPPNAPPDYDCSRFQANALTIEAEFDSVCSLDPAEYPYGYAILEEASLIEKKNFLECSTYKDIRTKCYHLLHDILNDPNNAEIITEESHRFLCQGVEELIRAKAARKVNGMLINKLFSLLDPKEQEAIMNEVLSKSDLYLVAKGFEHTQSLFVRNDNYLKALIKTFFVADDWKAYFSRAGFSGALDITFEVFSSTGAISATRIAGDCLSNFAAFAILSGVELYRFSCGEITEIQLGVNVGEHLVGCTAGIGGGLGGAVLGTMICPVVGTIIGSILGGIAADFLARAAYRKGVSAAANLISEAQKEKMITEAASTFGININIETYHVAKAKYRKIIIAQHPDRCPRNATTEEMKVWNDRSAKLIVHWNIVRAYYESKKQIPKNNIDAFARVFVLQVKDLRSNVWNTVRAWFENDTQFPVGLQGPQTQVIERILYY